MRTFRRDALRVCPYRFPVATTYRIPKLTSRREYFRLPYPVTSGAKLEIEGYQYKVGEISERGLRILSGIRFGLRPDLNAAATMMLAITLLGLGGAALILRRAARSEGAADPGIALTGTGNGETRG